MGKVHPPNWHLPGFAALSWEGIKLWARPLRWLKVAQLLLPMDLSNKPVHLLTPEEAKEPPAKKQANHWKPNAETL